MYTLEKIESTHWAPKSYMAETSCGIIRNDFSTSFKSSKIYRWEDSDIPIKEDCAPISDHVNTLPTVLMMKFKRSSKPVHLRLIEAELCDLPHDILKRYFKGGDKI